LQGALTNVMSGNIIIPNIKSIRGNIRWLAQVCIVLLGVWSASAANDSDMQTHDDILSACPVASSWNSLACGAPGIICNADGLVTAITLASVNLPSCMGQPLASNWDPDGKCSAVFASSAVWSAVQRVSASLIIQICGTSGIRVCVLRLTRGLRNHGSEACVTAVGNPGVAR
jgi:hypothetical protein